MSKTIVLVGAVGLAGVGLLMFMKKKSAASVGNKTSNSQNSGLLDFLGSGFGYPFKMPAKGRVDNQSQPWANPSKVSFGPNDSSAMQSAARDIGAGSSIIQSLSDIWGNVGINDWLGNNSSTLDSSDDSNYVDWDYAFSTDEESSGLDLDSDSGQLDYDYEVA